MKILDTISAALAGRRQPTAAKLAELLAGTEAETEAARARLAELEGQRAEKALAGESERTAFRAALATARDDIADGEAAIGALRERHATAVAAEAEDARRKTYRAAEARAAELPPLISEYEKAARAVRDAMRHIAEIDVVLAAANADLPAGAVRIAGSGDLRSIPAVPEEAISEKEVDLWCSVGSADPLGVEWQGQVASMGKGRGTLRTGGSREPMNCELRRFLVREIRRSAPGIHAVSFGDIRLPAARAGEEPILHPPVDPRQPRDILAAVDAAIAAEARPRPRNERPVITEYKLLRAAA